MRNTDAKHGVEEMNAKTKFSWKDAPDLMDALVRTQNAPCNSNIDIMTFAGLCDSRAKLEAHVSRYEAIETQAELAKIKQSMG